MSDLVNKLRDLAGRRHMDRGHDAVDDALREAADEIERFHSERSYIIGFNDGWEGAHEQQPGDDRPFVPEDRITALEKENAELRQLADDRLNDAVRLTNEKTDYWLRIYELEKALEPFAQAALAIRTAERMTRREFRDDDTFQSGVAWRDGDKVKTVTIGDFRRARLASSERIGE